MQNLKLLSPLGIRSYDTTKHLFYSQQGKQAMFEFLEGEGILISKDFVIALAPGAGTKIKQWPVERFAKLADHLFKKYKAPLFIVGGPGDKEEFEKMVSFISSETKIVSCLGQSIDELKAFVSYVDVMIANDSAPIYIAEAFGKATVTIVGPTDENEHPPHGKDHRVVKWEGKGTSLLPAMVSIDYNKEKAREQIERVTTEQVIETVDELVSYIKGKTA